MAKRAAGERVRVRAHRILLLLFCIIIINGVVVIGGGGIVSTDTSEMPDFPS